MYSLDYSSLGSCCLHSSQWSQSCFCKSLLLGKSWVLFPSDMSSLQERRFHCDGRSSCDYQSLPGMRMATTIQYSHLSYWRSLKALIRSSQDDWRFDVVLRSQRSHCPCCSNLSWADCLGHSRSQASKSFDWAVWTSQSHFESLIFWKHACPRTFSYSEDHCAWDLEYEE